MESIREREGDSSYGKLSEVELDLKSLAEELQLPILAVTGLGKIADGDISKSDEIGESNEWRNVGIYSDATISLLSREHDLTELEPAPNFWEGRQDYFRRYTNWIENLKYSSGLVKAIVSREIKSEVIDLTEALGDSIAKEILNGPDLMYQLELFEYGSDARQYCLFE